jgi:hypothetical protein
MTNVHDATFNLMQVQARPNWYEHLPNVEEAMRKSYEDWAVRQDYGWSGDEGGEWGPNPLQPGVDVLESDWEEATYLPFPEDFKSADCYVYHLMEVIGKYKHDLPLMAHMVALAAADYLGNVGEPSIGAIRSALRNSYIIQQADD